MRNFRSRPGDKSPSRRRRRVLQSFRGCRTTTSSAGSCPAFKATRTGSSSFDHFLLPYLALTHSTSADTASRTSTTIRQTRRRMEGAPFPSFPLPALLTLLLPGRKWNTTMKSIIPLPQPGDPSTYPDYDFAPTSYVLACYPETTSFYKAIVEAGPFSLQLGAGKVRTLSHECSLYSSKLTLLTRQKKETQRLYRLRFDDDDGQLRDVPLELVCEAQPL
jgi:hypothetical protein